MPAQTGIIKKRIRSVGNTKKITKAMEMVAAAKMRKAITATLATRDYAHTAWQVAISLAGETDHTLHKLLFVRPAVKNLVVILIAGNRGLCGSFNEQIGRKALDFVMAEKTKTGATVKWLALGKKARDFILGQKEFLEAEFDKPDIILGQTEVLPLAQLVVKNYIALEYDKVILAYTDFESALKQKPRIKQLLPMVPVEDLELGHIKKEETLTNGSFGQTEYVFEPNPDLVLDYILPRLIETELYQALLESTAAEHSARMLAMKNASEAAGEMIEDLTLVYNRSRQASITAEIAEIAGGKAALES